MLLREKNFRPLFLSLYVICKVRARAAILTRALGVEKCKTGDGKSNKRSPFTTITYFSSSAARCSFPSK